MNLYVADTHALFWYLTNSPRLGALASGAFDEAVQGEAQIYVPAIVLAELYYLNEKLGRPLNFAIEFDRLQMGGQFVFIPFAPEDTLEFEANAAVSEMHDRMIVGVARRLGATGLSFDLEITRSKLIPTLW